MSGIDVFAWIVLLVMIGAAVVVFVVLGVLPGRIARERGHPQAEDRIGVVGGEKAHVGVDSLVEAFQVRVDKGIGHGQQQGHQRYVRDLERGAQSLDIPVEIPPHVP